MTHEQAEELLDYISLERSPGSAHCRQLGNGQWVVIVNNPQWFCWSFRDWQIFRQQAEDKLSKREKQRKAQRRETQRAIDYSEQYRLAI